MFGCYNLCTSQLGFIEVETTTEKNPLWYVITIDWFPYDSDANKVANYRYENSSWDIDMIATFIAENWAFDVNKVSRTNNYWICQLQYNKTNKVWIDNEMRWDIMYQARICLEKRQAVPDPSKIWYWWNNREKQKSKILYINK